MDKRDVRYFVDEALENHEVHREGCPRMDRFFYSAFRPVGTWKRRDLALERAKGLYGHAFFCPQCLPSGHTVGEADRAPAGPTPPRPREPVDHDTLGGGAGESAGIRNSDKGGGASFLQRLREFFSDPATQLKRESTEGKAPPVRRGHDPESGKVSFDLVTPRGSGTPVLVVTDKRATAQDFRSQWVEILFHDDQRTAPRGLRLAPGNEHQVTTGFLELWLFNQGVPEEVIARVRGKRFTPQPDDSNPGSTLVLFEATPGEPIEG